MREGHLTLGKLGNGRGAMDSLVLRYFMRHRSDWGDQSRSQKSDHKIGKHCDSSDTVSSRVQAPVNFKGQADIWIDPALRPTSSLTAH